MGQSVEEICHYLDSVGKKYEYHGDEEFEIQGFSSLTHLRENSITWAKTPDRIDEIDDFMRKKILLVVNFKEKKDIVGLNYINCDEPKSLFFMILNHFYGKKSCVSISNKADVLTKNIGKDVYIGSYCHICEEVIIEEGVVIGNNVSIECPTKIGKNSIIHSGVIIGTDGFGYYKENKHYEKVIHFGGVTIGENVEIGANTCIDRGTLEDTFIGDGVKIDNLCHIAHNVTIEENSMVIALSLLGGSSTLKKNSYIAPGVVIKNQITIGENAFVGMGAVVVNDIEAGKVVVGVPARVLRDNKQE